MTRRFAVGLLTFAAVSVFPLGADEGGVSFWLPGNFGSFVAEPGEPGWTLALIYYYATSDAGTIDADGYVWVMSRTDDIINVAGHRLSTGAIEEVLAGHPDVAECAVVGVRDALRGQVPLGLVVLNAGVARDHGEIAGEAVRLVREQIGPVASFKTATVVARLPKTRSGKILRGTMQRIADGEAYRTPATIDDPAILDEIAAALRAVGYARN